MYQDNYSYAVILDSLAQVYQDTGRITEAKEHYKRALKIIENTVGKDSYSYAVTLENYAGLYRSYI